MCVQRKPMRLLPHRLDTYSLYTADNFFHEEVCIPIINNKLHNKAQCSYYVALKLCFQDVSRGDTEKVAAQYATCSFPLLLTKTEVKT